MLELMDERQARDLLSHTWHAFFGRFGRLTRTQRAAIAPIAAGRSTLICAPTASGKTEALVGPLLNRIIALEQAREGQVFPRLELIVVSPTRALCNDLLRRLRSPVEGSGQTIDLKSGDSPSFNASKPPRVLITTPESLDSMLCRRPKSLRGVQAIVLDEIHLVDGSGRGEQLRCLVTRLRALSPELQVCAASATAANRDQLAARYLGSDATVVTVGRHGGAGESAAEADGAAARFNLADQRQGAIELELFPVLHLDDASHRIHALKAEARGEKWIVFCNRRADVENLAYMLRDLNSYAHHGSLAKPERLRAEKQFQDSSSGIFVATTTLEIGVDIGDVDRVLLAGPPPNVGSMLQRIGRSNRRGGVIRAVGFYGDDFERLRFEHLLACARENRLFPEEVPFRPGVLVQQAMSLAYQNPRRWISAEALHARLAPDARALYPRDELQRLLDYLVERELFHGDARGRYAPDDDAHELFTRGQMHTNIAPEPEMRVIDEATGRFLGTTARVDQADVEAMASNEERLLLGGQARPVTRLRDGDLYVDASDESEAEAIFVAKEGPRYSFELCQDLAEFAGQGRGVIRLSGGGSDMRPVYAQHYVGTTWAPLLAELFRDIGAHVLGCGAFRAKLRDLPRRLPTDFGSYNHILAVTERTIARKYRDLARRLAPGPYKGYVPDELTRKWVEAYLRPAEFAHAMTGFLIEVPR